MFLLKIKPLWSESNPILLKSNLKINFIYLFYLNSYISNILKLNSTTKMMDVPYCDHFQIEEVLTVIPDKEENSAEENKCILQVEVSVTFIKSLMGMIKNKIESKTIEGIKQDYELYFRNITEKFKKKEKKVENEKPR